MTLEFVGRVCACTAGGLIFVMVQFFFKGETAKGIMAALIAVIFALVALVIILLQDKR